MAAQAEAIRTIQHPEVFGPALYPAPYKVLYGGRGRGASWFVSRHLLLELTGWDPKKEPALLLCTREYQSSIRESVYQLLKNQIRNLDLPGWRIMDNELRCSNGCRVIFAGLRKDIDAIKSYEGINRVWIEEAETVSENSITTLLPTIRREDGTEIWIVFNPKNPKAPVFKRFVENPPPGSVVIKSSYRDNPYFPEVLRKQMEWDRKVNPDLAKHVWDGEFLVISDAQIFGGKYSIDDNWAPGKDWHGPYYGADWGDVHPTCLVKCWVNDRNLYVDDEAGGSGIELDEIGPLFKTVGGADSHVIRADPSLPATIRHVCKSGLNVVPAVKGPGSVEDGIKFLKNFAKIIVRPRCKGTIEELDLYSYKVDKLTGDVLPIIIDAFNHRIDAIRYALEPMIRKRPAWGVS